MQMDAEDGTGVRWSELPEGIVGSIQARLPVVSLLRSRAVCKEWKAAVASPWLLQERLGAVERESVLCVMSFCEWEQSDVACCVYERASNRWYELPLPPWLRTFGAGQVKGQYLEVPDGSRGGNGVLVSCCYSSSGSFKLVALGEPVPGNLALAHDQGVNNPIPIVTYVYDSALGRWSATSSAWPGRLGSQRWMSVEGAFVDSILYHVVGREGNLLVAYDLERDKWSWLEVESTQARHGAFIVYCSLLTLRQRLLCLVFLALCDRSMARDRDTIRESDMQRLKIWELDFARMTWMVVDTMPAPILTHFGRTCSFKFHEFHDSEPVVTVQLFDRIQAVAPGGLDSEFEVYLINDHVDKVLAVDLHRTPAAAAWRWLPSCPYKQFPNKYMYRLDPWLEFGSCKQV